jgi:hypothetical protein
MSESLTDRLARECQFMRERSIALLEERDRLSALVAEYHATAAYVIKQFPDESLDETHPISELKALLDRSFYRGTR